MLSGYFECHYEGPVSYECTHPSGRRPSAMFAIKNDDFSTGNLNDTVFGAGGISEPCSEGFMWVEYRSNLLIFMAWLSNG